jgi:ubiquinone biosynthesis O-methyltransferase
MHRVDFHLTKQLVASTTALCSAHCVCTVSSGILTRTPTSTSKWVAGKTAVRSLSDQRIAINVDSSLRTAQSLTVDAHDVANFERLSNEWLDENGPFKALHSFNRLRVPWIVSFLTNKEPNSALPLKGLRLLDVGCGGGILSFALARLGADVVALDASAEAVKTAQYAAERTLRDDVRKRITFRNASLEEIGRESPKSFDGVVASEVVEHVSDLELFVKGCVNACKKSSPMFFTTINRTIWSRIFAIWVAEDVLSLAPKGVHQWEKFVQPNELRRVLENEHCRIRLQNGIAYNFVTNKWSWSALSGVNYALLAQSPN